MKITKQMRSHLANAIVRHGYGERMDALQQECLALREEAIERFLGKDGLAAAKVLSEKLAHDFGRRDERLYVNCGGPKISLNAFPYLDGLPSLGKLTSYLDFGKEDYEGIMPTRLPRPSNEHRLDLEADDDLAKRCVDWAERFEAFKDEARTTYSQVRGLLTKVTTVARLKATWPNAWGIIEPVLEAYGAAEKEVSLPAVTDLDAKLGLPPSNDDTEVAQAA